VADAIVDKLDEGGDNEGELLAAATPGERADSIVESVEGEVNNGRFSQFFTNSSGSLTRQAIATAALVGAQEPERVLRAAARVFPGGQVPVDRARRNEVFERLPDSAAAVLERLDVRWYALDRGPDRRLRASIDAHPDQFFRS